MPNPSGTRDIARAFSGQLEGTIPGLTGPFGLDLCGFKTWIVAGATTLGMLGALGFALATGGSENRNRDTPPPDFDFGNSEIQSPGLSEDLFEALGDILREGRQ